MVEYTAFKVHLTEGQRKKISSAYKNKTDCTLQIDTSKIPNDTLRLTKTQIEKLKKGKARITVSKSQLQLTGGFLPFLAALIPGLIAAGKAAALGAAGTLGGLAVKKMAGKGCPKKSGKGVYQPWER